MVDLALKVRVNRARRRAMRQGLFLQKNPRRDPNALDYGTFLLLDLANKQLVHASVTPDGRLLTIDDVEAILDGSMDRIAAPIPGTEVRVEARTYQPGEKEPEGNVGHQPVE